MARIANLNVDVLIDFISGTLPVPGGEEVVHLINAETEKTQTAGLTNLTSTINVFMADCHDEENEEHFSTWVIHCLRGTEGQKFHPMLKIPDYSFVVYKGTGKKNNGYSGFDTEDVEIYITEGGHLLRLQFKTLHELLTHLEVETNIIRGLATNFCDKATAIDSAKLGYRTCIDLRACRGIPFPDDDPRSEKNAIEEMEKAGVIIMH